MTQNIQIPQAPEKQESPHSYENLISGVEMLPTEQDFMMLPTE